MKTPETVKEMKERGINKSRDTRNNRNIINEKTCRNVSRYR